MAKIIDGFNPPDTEIRQRLAKEDPDYDPVDAYMKFAYASGDEFLANMKFLIDFVNVLPTLTRSFSNRYGLPARLQLRWFHPDDANRYFLFLRDSNIRALRNIFSGAKFIGTAPIYTNEKVAWKFMSYPGPWLVDPARPDADRALLHLVRHGARRPTRTWPTLRRRVVGHDALREGLQAARVVGGSDRLVLETDVVVVGSGAGGSFVAAELAAKTDQRVLIVEKGDFIEPSEFLQRERLMMPRILDTEFSVIEVFGRTIPTVSTAVATGKLVGGSATINHALAFEPPRPVIRDWQERLGAQFGYDDLTPHLEAIRTLLRIAPGAGVADLGQQPRATPGGREARPAASRADRAQRASVHRLWLLRSGLSLQPQAHAAEHGPAHGGTTRGPGDRQLPRGRAAPREAPRRRARRPHPAGHWGRRLPDGLARRPPGTASRSARAAWCWPPARSPLRASSCAAACRSLRAFKGSERAVGERFSTHATITFCSDFDEAIFPSAATPPMGYFVKKYEVEDQATADPARDQVRYALEGLLNHPLAHAQLMPYESSESHQAFMKRFNQTMTLAVMFRDRPVGRVTSTGFEYALAEEDHAGWLDSLRTGARIMFAAGGRRVFFNSHRPLILNSPDEIDTTLTLDLVSQQRIQITSGHPMGGCALGGDARRDVVDSRGRSWDVDGLYVADSSLLPDVPGREPLLHGVRARSVHRQPDGGRDPRPGVKC